MPQKTARTTTAKTPTRTTAASKTTTPKRSRGIVAIEMPEIKEPLRLAAKANHMTMSAFVRSELTKLLVSYNFIRQNKPARRARATR